MVQLDFDANQHEPVSTDFEPLPAGVYLGVLIASAMKPCKNEPGGEYLELEFEIIDGPSKGRHLWDRLTLKHSNAKTVQISKGKLSALCRAVGVLQPQDSAQLHNLPLALKVKCKKRADTGAMTNEIAAYHPREKATPQAVQGTPSTPPWRR